MKNLEISFLQSELNRVTDFIKFADKKAAFITTIYSAILAYWVSSASLIQDIMVYPMDLVTIGIIIGLSCLIAGFYDILYTVFPRIENVDMKKSLFFFGQIASLECQSFCEQIQALTEEEIKTQLIEQIHVNSKIVAQKMKTLKTASFYLVPLVIVTILFSL